MIRKILMLGLLACSQLASADDGIMLDLAAQPDRLIKSTSDSSAEVVMDLKGDDKLIEMNRKRGITFPVTLSSESKKVFTIKTGKVDDKKTFLFTVKLMESSSSSKDKEGKAISMPDPLSEFVDAELNGALNPQFGMRLTGITGKKLSPDKEQQVSTAFASMLKTFTLAPVGPLKVGDNFSQQTPFSLPMVGQQPMRFTLNTKYTLKRIEKEKAYFDVDLTFDQVKSLSRAKIDLKSSGSGMMVYNLATKLQEKLTLTFEMDLKASEKDVTVSSKMKSTSTVEQEIVSDDKKS